MTAVDQKGELVEIPIEAPSAKKVELSYASDDSFVLKQVIERAKGGQQVLWIENTVNEAQKLHERLSEALSGTTVELGIIHSRFTVADREVNEHRWIDVLGKNRPPGRNAEEFWSGRKFWSSHWILMRIFGYAFVSDRYASAENGSSLASCRNRASRWCLL